MSRRLPILAGLCVLALVSAACARDAPEQAVSLSITSPPDGSAVPGNLVSLAIEVSGIEIVPADGDTSGESGHFHVFIDREPVAPGEVIPTERGIVHSADNPIQISGLSIGDHDLVVVVGDGAHNRIGDFQARVSVTVEGPSVQATVPATIASDEAVMVELKAEGVTIVPADADTSGATGHYHIYIDSDPTPPGDIIPPAEPGRLIHTGESTVVLEGLGPGEHFIWVVLGDGVHRAFDPPVIDRVSFTIQ